MARARTLPPVVVAPTHSRPDEGAPCLVMTEVAIHTVGLPEGHFAAIVVSNPGPAGPAAISVLDRDEVEAHILLLRNAIDDAERADRGEAMVNDSPSRRTH